jgi:uncharacterized membrane protein YhaH (DUF805 family)
MRAFHTRRCGIEEERAMQGYLAIMGRGFRSVLNFGGRTPRRHFWPYVLTLTFAMMVAVQLLMQVVMAANGPALASYAQTHPDEVQMNSGPGGASVHVSGAAMADVPHFFSTFLQGMIVIGLVFVVLAAGMVVRRLHDSGRTGAWGLLPLVFLASGFTMMSFFFMSSARPMGLFMWIFLNNFIYLVSIAVLIYLLCQPSEPIANRFGEPPPADA